MFLYKAYSEGWETGPVGALNSVEFAENYDSRSVGASMAEMEYIMQEFGISYNI